MVKTNYSESWIDTYKEKLGSINFTTGDYNSIKEAIRKYVSIQNPENINDWQESSETGLFVNATAYLAENINYRIDLNVNDLFPSTTKRKQSLLNFTKMLSYSAKRNYGANGLAKITSISTTQDVYDNMGNSLQNINIQWGDDNNINWLEQFLIIMNSAFPYTNQFSKPLKNMVINNISNQLYQTTSAVNNSCVYPFKLDVNNVSLQFEVVNPNISIEENAIVEATPIPEQAFNLIYRNDGYGNLSNNTGFFVFWKQGDLHRNEYNFTERVENNFINITDNNISQSDVWFENIDDETNEVKSVWTRLSDSDKLSYNNVNSNTRTIYTVETQNNDKIKVRFPDGYFGDIPYGKYKLWYRTTNGNDGIYIKPSDMTNVSITIPYFNNSNVTDENVYYLTLTFSVMDVSHIRQAVPSETIESIRKHAPEVYSTQNRMVSSKDYNYFPKTIGQELKILKSLNRTHIGNSRYAPINDSTGTYTDVDVISDDGFMYSTDTIVLSESQLLDDNVEKLYIQYIEEKLSLLELENLYYKYYEGTNFKNTYEFKPTGIEMGKNYMCGKFVEEGTDSTSISQQLNKNDLLCLCNERNELKWVTITEKRDDIIILNETLDINYRWFIYKGDEKNKIYSKIPTFQSLIEDEVKEEIINYLTPKTGGNLPFIITYVNEEGLSTPWCVELLEDNESVNKKYNKINDIKNEDYRDRIDSQKFCMNWIFKVVYDSTTKNWKFYHRETKNIFGSAKNVSFFFNETIKTRENNGYFISKDIIKMHLFDNEDKNKYVLNPYNTIGYSDGYTDRQKFVCRGYDEDRDYQLEIPSQFNILSKSNDIIILMNENNDGTDEYIDFVDLYTPWFDYDDENEAAFKTSLWGHTNTSGYYYTYNKMEELIIANNNPKSGRTEFFTPHQNTILLSNGTITSMSGNKIFIGGEYGTKDYDFVDYIKGYDIDDRPIFYNDIIDDGSDKVEKHGYLYYMYSDGKTKYLKLIDDSKYTVYRGRKNIVFEWKHKANKDYTIDPCTTNIIDMFVLTTNYYNKVQEWINNGKKESFPKAPSAYELKGVFGTLENNKMISDTMVWHPITYKLIFGYESEPETRCIFKVIKTNELITDNEVKKSVITCIDEFFKNMGVGESFYFTQLSTYIETRIPDIIKSVVIVPTDTDKSFGELFQIACDDDQILLSTASLADVQIISSINNKNIRML